MPHKEGGKLEEREGDDHDVELGVAKEVTRETAGRGWSLVGELVIPRFREWDELGWTRTNEWKLLITVV